MTAFQITFKVRAESLIIRAFQYARKVQEQLIQPNGIRAIPDQGEYFRNNIHIIFNKSNNQTCSVVLYGWLQQVSTYHSIFSLVTSLRQGEEH